MSSPEPDGFHDWYMANHERLQKTCKMQSVEPPYKDVYIFARAAWLAATTSGDAQSKDQACLERA
jgi:hypothetical protein